MTPDDIRKLAGDFYAYQIKGDPEVPALLRVLADLVEGANQAVAGDDTAMLKALVRVEALKP